MTPDINKILSEKNERIGRIIFNNPERRNAMSLAMWQTAKEVLQDFIDDPEIRVIVLSGAGGKAFVSGADISKFATERATVEDTQRYNKATGATSDLLSTCPKPTIAQIQGFCMGGGLALALCCDLRICTVASQFGLPAAKLSVGYGFGGIRRLAEIVGPAFAREITFTGRRFSSQEAEVMGLVNRIVPEAELASYVSDYATTIADNAPLTIAAMKKIFVELGKDPDSRDLDGCQTLVERCFGSEDYVEGRQAFLEKRKPNFQGR